MTEEQAKAMTMLGLNGLDLMIEPRDMVVLAGLVDEPGVTIDILQRIQKTIPEITALSSLYQAIQTCAEKGLVRNAGDKRSGDAAGRGRPTTIWEITEAGKTIFGIGIDVAAKLSQARLPSAKPLEQPK